MVKKQTMIEFQGGGATRKTAPDSDLTISHSEDKDNLSPKPLKKTSLESFYENRYVILSLTQNLSILIKNIWHFWWQKRKKAAFTMAEVLITLGIIGIVAAMTLPSLIARHRSKVLEAQFKKRYSELSQAILNIKQQHEIPLYGNLTGGNLQPYIAAQFRGAKIGGYLYPLEPDAQKNRIGFSLPVYKTYNKAVDFSAGMLDDGSVIVSQEFFIFINTDQNDTTSIQLIVDINGLQAPNIAGYDLFLFRLDKNDSLRTPDWNGGVLCSKTSTATSNGSSCSYYAMTDKNYFKNLNW